MNNKVKLIWLLPVFILLAGGIFVSTLHSMGKTMSRQVVATQSAASATSSSFLASATPSLPPTPQTHSTPQPTKKAIELKKVSTGLTVKTKKTKSGHQTVIVKTHKVIVAVPSRPAPLPSSSTTSPSPSTTDTTGDSWFGGDGRILIAAAPDWNGFVAPTASFVGVSSCVKSTKLEADLVGNYSYPYIVSEKWKLTGGNFYIYDFSVGDLRHFTPSDTYYETLSDEKFFTNIMNLTMPSDDIFEFLPFNYLPMSRWADGTADTVRDTNYTVTSIYKQSECTG